MTKRGRPALPVPHTHINVRVPTADVEAVEAIAKRRHTTLSAVVRQIVKAALAEDEKATA
jgi:hypothetical protein